MLDLARSESGKHALVPEPVNVREALEEPPSLVRPMAVDCACAWIRWPAMPTARCFRARIASRK